MSMPSSRSAMSVLLRVPRQRLPAYRRRSPRSSTPGLRSPGSRSGVGHASASAGCSTVGDGGASPRSSRWCAARLACRWDVVVDEVADVHGSVGLDAGLLQGPLPHARTGCLGEVDLLQVDDHVEALHEPVAFQRRDVLLARVGDYAELHR